MVAVGSSETCHTLCIKKAMDSAQNPKLEDYPLSKIRGYFLIYRATLKFRGPPVPSANSRHVVFVAGDICDPAE